MDAKAVLIDAAGRPVDAARAVLDGISDDVLHTMPGGSANPIAWLVWHAARQMDVQLSQLTGTEQVWTDGWATRVGLERSGSTANDFGFGDSPGDVARTRVGDATALGDYLAAVVSALDSYIGDLAESDLDDVVDTSWDPPVTRGVRLVSLIDDAAVHVGQAAYVRGLLEGWLIGY